MYPYTAEMTVGVALNAAGGLLETARGTLIVARTVDGKGQRDPNSASGSSAFAARLNLERADHCCLSQGRTVGCSRGEGGP